MFLILVLSTLSSGTDFAFSQSVTENIEYTPKLFSIDLIDGIGIKEPDKQLEKLNFHNISLHEKIGVATESTDQNFVLIKYDSNRKIMMERVFDRQSKFKINESKKLQTSFLDIIQLSSNDLIFRDHDLLSDKFNFKMIDDISNIFEEDYSISNFIISPEINFNYNNIELINDQIFDPDNPILLILLIPLAGFILIRYDNEQTKFYQIKQFFTLIFVVILVSSAVITPVSISSSYWGGYAFAELDNGTETIPISEFESNIILQGNTTTADVNNISESDFSNIFSSGPFSIKPNNELSISDMLSVNLLRFLSTPFSPSDLPTTDSHMSISDMLSVTLSRLTNNGTSTTSNFLTTDSHMSTFTKSSGNPLLVSSSIGQTVDTSQTMEWFQGHTHDAADNSIGKEELERVRLTSSTNWEWRIQNTPNTGDQEVYLGLVDWNNDDVSVQRGLTSIASSSANKTLTSVTDFTAVDRSRSLLFVSFFKGDDGPNSYAQDTTYVRATIQPDGDLTFARAASDISPINIAWTLVELPEDYANVRHGIHHQDSGTSNDTFTLDDPIVDTTREFAISTVCTPFGCGGGTSDTVNAGSVSDVSATIVVENANTVRVQRGGSVGNFDIGYQVIEFLPKKVSLDDTVTISDTISTIKVAEVTLDETLNVSDEITGVLMALVTLTETLDISDVLTTNKVGSVTLDDTVAVSDVLTTNKVGSVTLDDTVAVSDVLTTNKVGSWKWNSNHPIF